MYSGMDFLLTNSNISERAINNNNFVGVAQNNFINASRTTSITGVCVRYDSRYFKYLINKYDRSTHRIGYIRNNIPVFRIFADYFVDKVVLVIEIPFKNVFIKYISEYYNIVYLFSYKQVFLSICVL